jgi:VanZ family protein
MNSVVSIPFRIRASWLILSIGIGTSIAVLTLMPQTTMPKAPQGMDKVYHALAFAFLLIPTALLRPTLLRFILPLAIAYGGMIEIIQPYFGRSADLADLVADSIGAIAGVGVGMALRMILAERTFWRQH